MDKELVSKLKSIFDEIAHQTEDGIEFWYARELQKIFKYHEWRNFVNVIDKAKISCQNSENNVSDHFVSANKMVQAGVATKEVEDIMLTRYACYLIAQNGDPRKDEIAFSQSYFAVQVRKQEIIEERIELINRMQLREQLKTSEKRLSQNIYERGVDDKGFGRIRSKGDSALFGGNSTSDMKQKYGIKTGALADYLPPVTIAAKNLATEMTNYNVEEEDLQGEYNISNEHIQNNQSVRKMLGERNIKPETLPPAEDIKRLERRVKADEKRLASKDKLSK